MTTSIDAAEAGTGKPARVVIACQRRLLALGLEALLAPYPDLTFVGVASHPTLVRAHLVRSSVDILLVAWSHSGSHAQEIVQEVAAMDNSPKVIVMATEADADAIREAFLSGAAGYLSEDCDDEQIIDALRAVAAGRIIIETGGRRFTHREDPTEAGPEVLTERERSVLTLIASGLSTKQIAQALFLSPKTVETHRSNIMRKLDLTSVADTVRYALRTGLLTQGSPEDYETKERG